MRINCPFCGERDSSEFSYLGAASRGSDFEGVYLRDNPAGLNEELWYHAFGCRSWLQVTRDTRTHVIGDVRLAKESAS
jgi:methylglutamate dehydrogenase subunit B